MTFKKYALITGATSGIGKEFASILSKSHNLVLVARNQKKLETTKKYLLDEEALDIQTICCNLNETQSAEYIFRECEKKSLHIEILINNAGVGVFGEHISLEDSKVIDMLNLNIITLTFLCKYFAKKMKKNGSGYILNVASLAAYQPVPSIAAYAASKSYVLNFSEALSKELEDYGVVVTCLSPGHTKTNFFKSAGIGDKEEGFYGLKTRISPRKVAEIGLKALFSKRLSIIPGIKNNFLANINRFSPRSLTAKISKILTKNA